MQIPPLKVHFSESDRAEIEQRIDRCLATGQVAQGPNLDEFEESFAHYTRSPFALALSNGGSAIEVSMWALNVKGKEVLVPTNTFIATASGIVLAGGRVKLVDCAPGQSCPGLAEIQQAAGPETAGVVLVHIGGMICPEIKEICEWCAERGLWVFEDCAHAHGAELDGRAAGTFGVAGAYSFFSTKVITSGEGGMLITADESLGSKVRLFRNYGKPDPWITYSVQFGGNWRLNELAAAVGVVHLKRLDEFISWRQRIASLYSTLLSNIDGLTPIQPAGRSSWYKYIVLLSKGIVRDKFKAAMKERGVSPAGGVYDLPLHRQPVLEAAARCSFPSADDFCARHLCLPLYYGMTEPEAEYVVSVVKSLL